MINTCSLSPIGDKLLRIYNLYINTREDLIRESLQKSAFEIIDDAVGLKTDLKKYFDIRSSVSVDDFKKCLLSSVVFKETDYQKATRSIPRIEQYFKNKGHEVQVYLPDENTFIIEKRVGIKSTNVQKIYGCSEENARNFVCNCAEIFLNELILPLVKKVHFSDNNFNLHIKNSWSRRYFRNLVFLYKVNISDIHEVFYFLDNCSEGAIDAGYSLYFDNILKNLECIKKIKERNQILS